MLKKSYPYFSTFRTVFSNELKIKSDTEFMEKYCHKLLGARFFKNFLKQIKWMDACKKIHNTPTPNNNQKSTLVMTEKTPPIGGVKTNDQKYVRISKIM